MDLVPRRVYDLNRDCLRNIFNYLEVDDLVNVADAFDITKVNMQNMQKKKSEAKVNRCIQFAEVLNNMFLKKNGSKIQVINLNNRENEFGITDRYVHFYGYCYNDDDDFESYSSDDSSEANSLGDLNIDNMFNTDNIHNIDDTNNTIDNTDDSNNATDNIDDTNDAVIDFSGADFNSLFLEMILNKKESKKKNSVKCPRILRPIKYFGHVITEIIVKYENLLGKIPSEVDNMILTICHESLVSIVLDDIRKDSLSMICQSFPNIEKVKLCNGIISEKLSKFNNWFPKMRSLHLYRCFMPEKCIECHFPNLEELKIVGGMSEQGVLESSLKIAFDLNPQLKSLSLSGLFLDKSFLLFIENKLKFLNNLTVEFNNWVGQVKNVSDVVAIDSLISLHIMGHATTLPKIAITSKQLKLFGYHEYSFSDSNFSHMINVVKNNINIEILFIKYGNLLNILENKKKNDTPNIIKLINELPKLKEITIRCTHWQEKIYKTAKTIITILSKCKRITNLNMSDTHDHIYLDQEKQKELIESINDNAMIEGFDITSWDIEMVVSEDGIIHEHKTAVISLKKK